MGINVQTIALINLAYILLPMLMVLGIFYRWSLGVGHSAYAITRMFAQLLMIGYVLAYIFAADHFMWVVVVLVIMVFAASWISLEAVRDKRKSLLLYALLSVVVSGGISLVIIIFGVLKLDPWYLPQYTIPLAGMILSTAMNSVSLAAERFYSEIDRCASFIEARNIAFNASMIPIVNSLFAVGLVSLPGMMTGQILSGVSPLIAARYQIMVMCMLFGASGIASAYFLKLLEKRYQHESETEGAKNIES